MLCLLTFNLWRRYRGQVHCTTIDDVNEQSDIREGHHHYDDVFKTLDKSKHRPHSAPFLYNSTSSNEHAIFISAIFTQSSQKTQYCYRVTFKSTEKIFIFLGLDSYIIHFQVGILNTTYIVYFTIQLFSAQFLQILNSLKHADVVHTVNFNFVILILYNWNLHLNLVAAFMLNSKIVSN